MDSTRNYTNQLPAAEIKQKIPGIFYKHRGLQLSIKWPIAQ